MKKVLIVLISSLCFTAAIHAQAVNGDTVRVDRNILVLKVWGSHQERGYAHGYLLAPRIKNVFENYVLSSIFYNNAGLYTGVRTFFEQNCYFNDRYLAETGAMIQGMEDAGVSVWSQVLGRDVDSVDILMTSAIDELVEALECSSLSSWGPMTAQDSVLQGSLVITRMMDWTSNSVLKENHLVIVHIPSENDEQPWLSVAYSGFVAALSAVNDSGVTAFKNMGNTPSHPNPTNLYPALLAARDAVERCDYNNDGTCDVNDVLSSFGSHNFYGSSIIHATSEAGEIIPALAIECDNEAGDTFRTYSHDPGLPLYNIVCTNHFRALHPPVYCYRYNNITDSIQADSSMTADRSWKVMSGAAGVSGNSQMMQWIGITRTLKVSAATSDSPAYMRMPILLNADSLFEFTGVEENRECACGAFLSVSNVIFSSTIVVSYSGNTEIELLISLYDISGRETLPVRRVIMNPGRSCEIPLTDFPAGMYFLRIEGVTADADRNLYLTKKIFSVL
ncbi:T9SS type A sorting domain-containing protein [candidate division WOR-3 bacterium]|nr:T9SS type A sorting domain-containing protein [candidate division WOR-3 bacterium]